MSNSLNKRRIALAESRELEVLARMLDARGAQAIRCPLVAIHDAPDPAPVEAWMLRMIAGEHDDVVLYTGEGVRRLIGFAERAGLRDDFVTALSNVRKITRGPKPVRALREIGLSSDLAAANPTTDGIIATLDKEELSGRTVGVQAYGQTPNAELISYLQRLGAQTDVVAPYRYASETDNARVEALIRDLHVGQVDAIVFTSAAQIERLTKVAEKAGLHDELREGLKRTQTAVVGPVAADALKRLGVDFDTMPEKPFAMKPLVNAIEHMFAEAT